MVVVLTLCVTGSFLPKEGRPGEGGTTVDALLAGVPTIQIGTATGIYRKNYSVL